MNISLKVLRNHLRSNLYSGANISHRNIHLFFELLIKPQDRCSVSDTKQTAMRTEGGPPVFKPQNCQNGTNITK